MATRAGRAAAVILMRETLSNYRGLLQFCPELEGLQKRICEALA